VTPRKTSASRRAARRSRPESAATPAGVDFDVAFNDDDLKTLEPH
jgi:predicted flap endonuclease-1-like 5' DNA nuclease